MTATIDPRCPWVEVHPAPAGPAWRLVDFKFENAEESGNDHTIYVHVLREDGTPAHVQVQHGWPTLAKPDETNEQWTNAEGNVNWAMWDDSIINEKHPRGPYWIRIFKQASDAVDGMGLPALRHVNYRLFYQWQTATEPPPTPPPDEEPGFWTAVRAVSSQIPPAQFISMPWQGHTYNLSRYAGGGIIAVEADRPGMIFLMYGSEVLKGQ